jgi:hypothetical protein
VGRARSRSCWVPTITRLYNASEAAAGLPSRGYKCTADERKCSVDVALDELGLDVQDAKTAQRERLVAKPVVVEPLAMHAAVDLDHKSYGGREEVDDEGPEDDLAPESDAKLAGAKGIPELALGGGWVHTHVTGTRSELVTGNEVEGTTEAVTHEGLLCPRQWGRGAASLSESSMTTRPLFLVHFGDGALAGNFRDEPAPAPLPGQQRPEARWVAVLAPQHGS